MLQITRLVASDFERSARIRPRMAIRDATTLSSSSMMVARELIEQASTSLDTSSPSLIVASIETASSVLGISSSMNGLDPMAMSNSATDDRTRSKATSVLCFAWRITSRTTRVTRQASRGYVARACAQ